MLTIGRLAQASGVNLETIRYYERIGLLAEPRRTDGGHRAYEDEHRRTLTFIRRARELGFTLAEVRELLTLAAERDGTCQEIAAIARAHLANVQSKLADLRRLEAVLNGAVAGCEATTSIANCPVLEMLAE